MGLGKGWGISISPVLGLFHSADENRGLEKQTTYSPFMRFENQITDFQYNTLPTIPHT